MKNDHLPLLFLLLSELRVSIDNPLNSNSNDKIRSKIILKYFIEDLFVRSIRDNIYTLSSNIGDPDPLLTWYNFIMNCALQAGAIVLDGLGNMERYDKKNIITTPIKKFDRPHKSYI